MKLQVRVITCGGKFGCGMQFECPDGTTTERAAEVLRSHRAEAGHMKAVLDETNVRRTLNGEAPITMDELLGTVPKNGRPTTTSPILERMRKEEAASLATFKTEIEKMKREAK